jgi:hypothetical protein
MTSCLLQFQTYCRLDKATIMPNSIGTAPIFLTCFLLVIIILTIPRISRVVAVGHPHHVTQRGNYRQTVFETDQDYLLYLDWLKTYCQKHSLKMWAYCLMGNMCISLLCQWVSGAAERQAKKIQTVPVLERSNLFTNGRPHPCLQQQGYKLQTGSRSRT